MLFMGRYLIALYNRHDELVGVADNAREFAKIWHITIKSAESTLSRAFSGERPSKYIKFIDCFEVQDDIFKEEDEEFAEFAKDINKSKAQKNAEAWGCSERTARRISQLAKQEKNKNKEKEKL